MAYIQNNPFSRVAKTTKGKGRNFRSAEEGAGMTEKGVKAYKKVKTQVVIYKQL